jgi:hypothetical protein
MIYVRSRRPMVTLGVSGLAFAGLFALLAAGAARLPGGWLASIALAVGSIAGLAVAISAAVKLRSWPWARLGLFRDRIVIIQGNREIGAVWNRMDTVTLADPSSWPNVRLTDRLTIQFRKEAAVAFRPAQFGLQPVACRDLILKLRDDVKLRSRLPEFDSARDLAGSEVMAGELIEPRL